MKFADVKNDVAFHKIFGNENRKESLISFLNAVLSFEGNDLIVEVAIVNPYQLPKLRGGKATIIDVKATDQKKRQFLVEMQVADQDGFDKRVLYYIAKSYSAQIRRSEDYRQLKPAFFIGVLDFDHTQNPHYISRSRVQDIDTGEVTIRDVEFNFVELRKFNKATEELLTLADKWIYFIKNAENLRFVPENVEDQGLLSAYEEANQWTWTEEELEAYDYVFMREEDARAVFDKAMQKAVQKATEEATLVGQQIGQQIGEQIGQQIGEKIGEQKKAIAAVIGLAQNNVPHSIIALSLDISEEKVKEIIENQSK